MPGIAGIISRIPKASLKADVNAMLEIMHHEKTYTVGTYEDRNLNVYVGWLCHNKSFSDCMPILNEEKDLSLFFTGESFEDADNLKILKKAGHCFCGSNASYLIHLYEQDSEQFLRQLNGWFAGIILDHRRQKVILFNDRFGMERLYYFESENEFIFSSEAKSILKIRPDLRTIDLESLAEFFGFNCINDGRTFFKKIFLLPPASAWTFQRGERAKKNSYFSASEWEEQETLKKDDFWLHLRNTFERILPKYFRPHERIGMSLSSGLDTRAIMAWTGKVNSLPCYTFTGMYRDTLDARIGRKVAKLCSRPHRIIRLDKKFFVEFPKLAEKTVFVTDGYHEVLGASDAYFNAVARDVAPIRMTGKFGSEIIGNHSMLRKANKFPESLFNPDFEKYMRHGVERLGKSKLRHPLSFAVFHEIPSFEYGRLRMEQSKIEVRTPYMDNDLIALMYRAPSGVRSSIEMRLRLIGEGNAALLNIMTDRGTAGKMLFPLSTAAKVVCYALVKMEYWYLYQLTGRFLRIDYKLAQLRPERVFLGRHQIGYFRQWFQNELAQYVKDILLDGRSLGRSYINGKMLEKAVLDHTRGKQNYVNVINKALTTELVYRLLIEGV
jgi:asparagine synthase (glutamine-hydrolysing)